MHLEKEWKPATTTGNMEAPDKDLGWVAYHSAKTLKWHITSSWDEGLEHGQDELTTSSAI